MQQNKRRGFRFEAELVNDLELAGIPSRRAWGSNGESLGLHETVDILALGRWKIQAKRKKAVAKALIPTEHVDAVITRTDAEPGKRKPPALVIMRFDDWAAMVHRDEQARRQLGEVDTPIAGVDPGFFNDPIVEPIV